MCKTAFSWSARLFGVGAACATMLMLLANQTAAAESTPKPAADSISAGELDQQIKLGDWHNSLVNTPLPHEGCFKAEYPSTTLVEVPCAKPPNIPMPPRRGALSDTVGNGYDYSAQVPAKLISVVGSFDTANTTGETGFTYQSPTTQVANAYTLQLNSNFFYNPPACAGAASPSGCQGWQQYVYSSVSAGQAYIQYWLINYNKPCPSGWNPYGGDCYRNSASAVTVVLIPVTSLAQTSLTGSAAAGGNDRLDLASGATHYIMTSPDNIVTLANYWNTAEFTVVGDCCLYTANFAANTSITVRTTTHDGSKSAPVCVLEGFTGETNNLNLVSTPAIGTQASPTLISDQTSATASPASCATAAGVGDLHIWTFTPTSQANAPVTYLHYDFQAEGEFILAKTDDGFEVQTRQISGAPNWPLATVSQAIAAKIGKSAVVFAWVNNNPQVFINGSLLIGLGNGGKHVLPNDGDLILRQNTVDVSSVQVIQNTYVVRDTNGNSVQVIMQAAATTGNGLEHYIDVHVGLGRWPTNAQGLLVNAKDNLHAVMEQNGTVFPVHGTVPPASVDLPDFYSKYGDSWRVTGSQSLFTAAAPNLPALKISNPAKVFTASDLAADVSATAKANCQNAGVPDVALNDCILDVAVIGNWQAALSHLHPNLPTVVDRTHLVEH